MVFSSLTFLFCFLPVTLGLYYLLPGRAADVVLFLASLVFYAWGEPIYIFLMLLTLLLEYTLTLWMDRVKQPGRRKAVCAAAVVTGLSVLAFFKYADFLITNLNALGLSVPLFRLALPVGISFYTFQLISYVIDVYRGDVPAQKNFLLLGTYISMFPQLVAGPIVRYDALRTALENPALRRYDLKNGFGRLISGLAKKVLLANALGEFAERLRALETPSILSFWLLAMALTLQLYLDFSAYSDMAIGLGRLLGFSFAENFNYPLVSQSITEFWRRWHMSLGSWFRDYVYIPMGGNRVGRGRRLFNLLIIWLLTGLWHGAAWTFVLWGLYHCLFLILEKQFLGNILGRLPRFFRHLYVVFVVLVGFVLFRADTLTQFVSDLGGMFRFGAYPLFSPYTIFFMRDYGVVLLVSVFVSTPLPVKIVRRLAERARGWTPERKRVFLFLRSVVFTALFVLSTAHLVDGSFNPFLYFRF